jgi:5-methylcytosine-specific restriction endonuclease McrA
MENTQLCKRCSRVLSVECFSPSRRGKKGQRCRECDRQVYRDRFRDDPVFRQKRIDSLKTWKEKNPDRFKAAQRKHYEANKPKMHAAAYKHKAKNPEYYRESIKRWHKENRVRSFAHTRMRNLRIKGQTPPDADFEKICALYEESARLTRETGIRHHVDHIIPLSKGGMHHQDNLRVVTWIENLSKGAKLVSYA